jgi:hypothetical protein
MATVGQHREVAAVAAQVAAWGSEEGGMGVKARCVWLSKYLYTCTHVHVRNGTC